jgi:hypothetical protein
MLQQAALLERGTNLFVDERKFPVGSGFEIGDGLEGGSRVCGRSGGGVGTDTRYRNACHEKAESGEDGKLPHHAGETVLH